MPGRSARTHLTVSQPPAPPRKAAAPVGILPYLTVAIGASAGGLHAFTSFLENLPPDTGMAFVLIQHLDPVHKSLLVSLLAPHTAMPVVEAADGAPLEPNTVFVIPPDATMTVSGGRLVVVSPAPARVNRWPIDSFFASLAADQAPNAVCIVLAGAGSDGTRALRLVKQNGGLTLAQMQDDGQAMPGMPHSAMASGLIDHLLPVNAMPAKLLDYQQALREPRPVPEATDPTQADSAQFAEICALVRGHTGHDFSRYKQPTLMRRIRRCIRALHIDTVAELINLLRNEPQQIDRLFHELLIGVTQFFRDPAAFHAVEATILPQILAGKGADGQVRIWVPGCASGDEVYSLAISLKEAMVHSHTSPKVQIFGTDIDAEAIATARAARLSAAKLNRLTPELRDRWFVSEGEFYRPVREIRDMCVFSVHSVIKDPPFSKLDMVSCRNLLIYLDSELQSLTLRNFHYALNPRGWLFLGPSESVASGGALFAQVDKRHRIFQRQEVAVASAGRPPSQTALAGLAYTPSSPRPGGNLEDAIERSARRALEAYSPAYMVVDRAHNIVRFSGGSVGRFLEPSPGVANLGLFGILRKALRRPVRTAVEKAIAGHESIIERSLVLALEGHNHLVTLIVQPIFDGRTDQDRYLVAFHDCGPARQQTTPVTGLIDKSGDEHQALAQELAATRSQLLSTITELETANEELKSFNEEYQSSNEELQATNEELETAKEEMQSVNEELQTINAELTTKNELLTTLNNDLQNLLDSTQIATVFLDADLRVTRFTPPMTELVHLRQADVGRPITEIATQLAYTELPADVATVLGTQRIVEREVKLADGDSTFLMHMRPYRTTDKRIEGVVITFVDVSEPKRQQAQEALRTLNQVLERRVAERTAELQTANRNLALQTEERQRAEAMLRQSQKLEAVGKLTGGIAHDFNNLLGVIIGNVEFLLDALRGNPEHIEQAREIMDSALSGAALTRRLLAFASQQPLQPRLIDLNTLLPNHVTMLRRTLGETIRVTATLASNLWLTHADPSQIGDALLNLALNSRFAMPHGGSLLIETANVHLDEVSVAKGDFVVLSVTDTGAGMPPDVIERATEPFFTTKAPGDGSGLGLSMIYGFARQSGGHLKIDSAVGVGTTVRLYLPRAQDDEIAEPDVSDGELAEPRGNESILLVDDNPALRGVTQQHLVALGYAVRSVANGPAALDVLQSAATFDLLFTDVVMPEGLSGYDLADAARGVRPMLRVLFTTGYDGNGALDGQPVLRKPYRQRELARAVRAVLDAA